MNARDTNRAPEIESRFLSVDGLCKYLSLGRVRALDLAEEAGAKRRFGKRVLFDKEAINAYMDTLGAKGAD